MKARRDYETYAGCLLGGALGDALGWPVEFCSIDEIRAEHGPEGIREPRTGEGFLAEITDDTQMTLFTAEGLLDAVHAALGGTPDFGAHLHRAYLRWLRTQQEAGPGEGERGLLAIAGLYARRAPGHTCLGALAGGIPGTVARPINDSKGCGGVMRAAPAGLLAATLLQRDDDATVASWAFDLGVVSAAITHGHPCGHLPAGALAAQVALLVRGVPLERAVRKTLPLFTGSRAGAACAGRLLCALRLWEAGATSPEGIETLGGGWTGDEALAIAVHAALAAEGDFAKGVRLAVNHSGDSDSTGAIAGNLLGACLGSAALPKEWLRQLELVETVNLTAASLFGLGRPDHAGGEDGGGCA